jgi:hypothetical protein
MRRRDKIGADDSLISSSFDSKFKFGIVVVLEQVTSRYWRGARP